MVGNNTPVFVVRDPYQFPDFIHTQKRHPKTNLRWPRAIVERQLGLFAEIHPDYAKSVRAALAAKKKK